jgi:cytochrome c biogenesis protein
MGERVHLEGENIQISFIHFIPDFVLNEKNEAATRSLQPNNPAAFIEGWEGDEKIISGWIFAKFPDFSRIHSEKETDLSFELKNFKASQYSGIEAAKDPGANIIWVGCTFLMIGLAIAFYWPSREIKIILEEIQGKTGVIAGGIASKNREDFQSEFDRIMSSLRRSK